MGFWKRLLKALSSAPSNKRAVLPDRRKDLRQGFYWNEPGAVCLAAGRGFNQAVVGESFYRDDLELLTGGPTRYGVEISCAVELAEGSYEGRPSVNVLVSGVRCGSIPKADTEALIAELRAVKPEGSRVVTKGRVSAGYQGGDYSVAMSLARPLKARR